MSDRPDGEGEDEPVPSTDDEPGSPDPGQPSPPPDTPPRRRFRPKKEEELEPRIFLMGDTAAAQYVVAGGSVAADGGDAVFVGELIRRTADALHGLAWSLKKPNDTVGVPRLAGLAFGASVTVQFEIGEESIRESGNRLSSPTAEAADYLASLVAADPDELLPLALDLTQDAVVAYKRFLKVIAEDRVEFDWYSRSHAEEPVVLTSPEAQRDYAILDLEGEEEEQTIWLVGHLSLADDDTNKFGLRLPRGSKRPPIVKGKQKLTGRFDEDLTKKLREQNLWGRDVRARLLIRREVEGTAATRHDPEITLLDVEPLLPERPDEEGPTLLDK